MVACDTLIFSSLPFVSPEGWDGDASAVVLAVDSFEGSMQVEVSI
jgi:hypothetical protein